MRACGELVAFQVVQRCGTGKGSRQVTGLVLGNTVSKARQRVIEMTHLFSPVVVLSVAHP